MKNNQRSIDGFTPRRPIQNKIEKNMEDLEVILKVKTIRKIIKK